MSDEMLFARNDFIFLRDGSLLRTHPQTVCAGAVCCVHNPSQHPLADAPQNWRADRYLMERICAHGIGHPDPDDLAWKRERLSSEDYDAYGFGMHGCDGCCRKS